MIRFALVAASVLGFCLMAALGNLIVPLRSALQPPPAEPQPGSDENSSASADDNAEPEPAANQPPPFGGLCLMVCVLAASGVGWTAACVGDTSLLGSQLTTRLLTALGGSLLFGAIGALDDIVRMRRRSPLGLRRMPRFALEAAAAAILLALLWSKGWRATGIELPFAGYIDLGAAAPAVWGACLIALAECGRISDGADGTVCGTAFIAMLGLMCVLTMLGWFSLAVLPAAAAGALMALLIWDFPPTKLRPGAAGCMFAAGAIGCVPLCIGWPGLSLPLGLPFWLEGSMVAIQIIYSRLSHGRLLFATAPLHRWLEQHGRGPVAVFYIMGAVAVLGLVLAVFTVRLC